MTDAFLARVTTAPAEELRAMVAHPTDYRSEAVEGALAELARRGTPLGDEAVGTIREQLRARDGQVPRAGVLGRMDPATLRLLIRILLISGLGLSLWIYLQAGPSEPDALGYDPMDTKRYLRDLEVYGGKVNILATQFQAWFLGLWHGRPLAGMVALITVLLAWLLSLGARRTLRG